VSRGAAQSPVDDSEKRLCQLAARLDARRSCWGSVRGELGSLDDVSMNKLIPNKVFLAMEHLAERYITVLAFDDDPFANQLYGLLLNNIGRSIQEIGDLDLSHTL
jgi:hypothetical protein